MAITLRSAASAALIAALVAAASFTAPVKVLRAQQAPGPPMLPPGPAPRELRPNGGEAILAPDPSMPMVVDVRVEGNNNTSIDRIRPYVRTRKGRPLDPRLVEEDVRRLHSSRYFVDVRPDYRQVDGGVVLVFQVIERPTFQYVRFEGNEKVKAKKLHKECGIRRGGSADPYAVEEARNRLEEWYHEKGHTKAVVTIREGDKPGDPGAVFMIHEGPIQRVGKVIFEGNSSEIAPDGRLQMLVQSKRPLFMIPYIFPGFKGYADRDKVDADVDALTGYYRGLGFFQAKVSPEVIYDDDQKWATVRFVIYEGERSKVRNIRFVGNTRRTPEQLATKLKLLAGDYYHQQKLNSDENSIQEYYGAHGYLFCDVRPEVVFQEQPGEVDLVYRISEGARCRVGRINIEINGENPHTRRMTVLNRLDFRPGDIADIRKIRASERRLKASGLFLTNPQEGDEPRITFRAPDDEEAFENYAERPEPADRFRGQSPDPWDADDTQALPDDQLVELVVLPDNQVRVAPIQSTADARRQSWQSARPVAAGRADDGMVVRFQDYGGYTMPSFDVNRSAAPYGAPAYPAPQATAQPYAQPQPAAPANPRYAPSTTTQPPAQPFAQAQPQPNTPWPGATPPVYTPPPAQQQPVMQQQPAPVYASPSDVPPGGSPYASPQYQGPPYTPPAAGAMPPYGGTMPQPGIPPQGTGFDTPGQLIPDSSPRNWLEEEPSLTIPFDVAVTEGQTGRIMLGVGVNSNAGVVGNIVLDEQNFDWRRFPTSWADVRNATAWRGAGQHFRIEAMPGNIVQRYLVSFTEPYLFDTPVSLGLSGYFFSRQYLNWFEERLGGRVSLGYQLAPDLTVNGSLRMENVNISRPTVPTPPELTAVLGNSNLNTARVQLVHDTRDAPFLPSQGHRLSFAYEQGFGEFSFPRAEFEGSQYFLLRERPDGSGRQTLSFITLLGFTGDDTPIYENFFAGGFGTLRGFRFRGASPVSPIGGVIVGGRFSWVNTVEYMFPITATDALRMVAFCDFGTVEQDVEINWDQFRVSPGLGFRIAIPALGPAPLAFDFAVPVHKADTDQTQLFNFSVGIAR